MKIPHVAHNRLIAALPERARSRLDPLLIRERVELKQLLGERGGPIHAVYFPIDAVVSSVTSLSDNRSVEIATIGNDGMVGATVLIGTRFMSDQECWQVQVPGEVLWMDVEVFVEELSKNGPLRELVQRYLQALISQISQQVACNRVHPVNERCSHWLLLTHDRVGTDEFPMTQDFLSQMLGVRRASVTMAAGALQKAGIIQYTYGRITIVDREGLEGSTCECYRVIRDQFDRLLGPASAEEPQ